MKRQTKTAKAKPAPNGGYELGKTYFDHYWQSRFTVTAIHEPYTAIPWSHWAVTVQWEDGHFTTHCTDLDKRDKVLESVGN
jgi:hypothetical protein